MHIDGVTLYYSPECPYCQRVLSFMQSKGITLSEKNVLDPGIGEELERVSGQGGYPVLMIGTEPVIGSDKIIDYLQQRLDKAA